MKILSIDQSTAGTKAMLFDEAGALLCRCDLAHRQYIDKRGWVEHDAGEILRNVYQAVRNLLTESGTDPAEITAVGISNQRETGVVWDRESGEPLYRAVVWQCGRAKEICDRLRGERVRIKLITGLNLSPYFTAGKWAWLLENIPSVREAAKRGRLCCGTVDSWLLFSLTKEHCFKTDYSNASRTQLFDIRKFEWSEELCGLFGLERSMLPEVCFSDSLFGHTDFGGLLPHPVPIRGVLGDSHGALLGQGCLEPGMAKATYGTGSSVMMNTGDTLCASENLVTSLAWGLNGRVNYVLEGNLNYTGAVMKWITDDLGLLQDVKEAGQVAAQANPADRTILVPAFTGLGAPYWDSAARAAFFGMSRTTGRAELVRAAEECIAYQIADLVGEMQRSSVAMSCLCADGGPTKDAFLMQFQSDMIGMPVEVSRLAELSGAGAAYAAGLGAGLYEKTPLFERREKQIYTPEMAGDTRENKYSDWREAVGRVLYKEDVR